MKTLIMMTVLTGALTAEAGLLERKIITDRGQAKSVLANSFRQTLYTFDPDQGGNSACDGKCAEVWPPLLLSEEEAASIVPGNKISVVVRKSGLKQLAYDGRPVYTFYADRAEGDIKGNGLGGVWHIVVLPAVNQGPRPPSLGVDCDGAFVCNRRTY